MRELLDYFVTNDLLAEQSDITRRQQVLIEAFAAISKSFADKYQLEVGRFNPASVKENIANTMHKAWLQDERKLLHYLPYTHEVHKALAKLVAEKLVYVDVAGKRTLLTEELFYDPTQKYRILRSDIEADDQHPLFQELQKSLGTDYPFDQTKSLNTIAANQEILMSLEIPKSYNTAQWQEQRRKQFLAWQESQIEAGYTVIRTPELWYDILLSLGSRNENKINSALIEIAHANDIAFKINEPALSAEMIVRPVDAEEIGEVGLDNIRKDLVNFRTLLAGLKDGIDSGQIKLPPGVAEQIVLAFELGIMTHIDRLCLGHDFNNQELKTAIETNKVLRKEQALLSSMLIRGLEGLNLGKRDLYWLRFGDRSRIRNLNVSDEHNSNPVLNAAKSVVGLIQDNMDKGRLLTNQQYADKFRDDPRQVIGTGGFAGAYNENREGEFADLIESFLQNFNPREHIIRVTGTLGGAGIIGKLAKKTGFTVIAETALLASTYANIPDFVDYYTLVGPTGLELDRLIAVANHSDRSIIDQLLAELVEAAGLITDADMWAAPVSLSALVCDVWFSFGAGPISQEELLAMLRLAKKVVIITGLVKNRNGVEEKAVFDKDDPTFLAELEILANNLNGELVITNAEDLPTLVKQLYPNPDDEITEIKKIK